MISRQQQKVLRFVQRLVIMAVFVAMTFVVTTYINVRIPFLAANGGLVHLGNVPVFVAAAVFGKRRSGYRAFGLGLFDLLNGWVAWAPFTFVICGLIGFTYGLITKGKYETRGISFQIAAVVAAVVIKVVGYYIAEVIIYGKLSRTAASIPGKYCTDCSSRYYCNPDYSSDSESNACNKELKKSRQRKRG